MSRKAKLYKPRVTVIARPREHRDSRHIRGYDSVWTRRAARFMIRFPMCAECAFRGFVTIGAVVDHKTPVRLAPSLRLDRKNWWTLCDACHNGFKRRLEAYAERTGQVDKLIFWCDNPENRPEEVKFIAAKRPKEEFVV